MHHVYQPAALSLQPLVYLKAAVRCSSQAYPDELGDPKHPCQTQKQDDVEGQILLKAGDSQPYNLQHRQDVL